MNPQDVRAPTFPLANLASTCHSNVVGIEPGLCEELKPVPAIPQTSRRRAKRTR